LLVLEARYSEYFKRLTRNKLLMIVQFLSSTQRCEMGDDVILVHVFYGSVMMQFIEDSGKRDVIHGGL